MTSKSGRDPVGRALELLAWLADTGAAPCGVRDVARATGMSPTTVHRLLTTFEEHSLLRRDETGKYYAGLELFRLGRLASQFSVKTVARPLLEQLAADTGETAMLGVYDQRRAEFMVIDSVQTTHPLRYVVTVNTWRPIFAGAAGLCILAFLDADERTAALRARPPHVITGRTLTSIAAIEEFCVDIRDRGYAISRGQRTEGAVGMAVPIRDADAKVIGDLCLTIPDNRFKDSDEERYAQSLRAAADTTSEMLRAAGYRLSPSLT